MDPLDRKLLFVTGKGGVGKTTVAAGLALRAASLGKRTLVCEVDAKGDLATFLETGPLTFDARVVSPDLWAMCMQTEESLKEYLRLQLKVPLLARIGPLARTFDFVASAAPGVKEILTVGKFCWEVLERNYDLVVVDASATGHVVSQLAAPQAINELVQVGLVRSQTSWMLDILGDPTLTGAVIVATPQEMPIAETLELRERLAEETNVDLATVVVNRVLPELFTSSEEALFDRLADVSDGGPLDGLVDTPGPLLDGARLAVTLRRTQARHLARLRSELGDDIPVLYLPELFTRAHGVRVTRLVADALGEELD
ncbi:MAG: ArsA family ATPase [Actinobacteria bacterium]|nr:ArsA family ATPase [Actinomycetota bacterium]